MRAPFVAPTPASPSRLAVAVHGHPRVNLEATELVVPARPTAVIAAATTWQEFPRLWRELLDEVWRTLRPLDGVDPGRNVMLYKDDTPHVEVGGEVAEPFPGAGRVVGSTLPAGRVVTATHRGPWEQLDRGHRAVADYCERHGLRRIGPRWEIYGHATPVSAEQKVEISYLVG